MGWVQVSESSLAGHRTPHCLHLARRKLSCMADRGRIYRPFPIAVDKANRPRLAATALGKGYAMGTMGACWAPRRVPHTRDSRVRLGKVPQ